ncbi:hypothetical protein ABPG72_014487 [Tetrahymena utriculariae]
MKEEQEKFSKQATKTFQTEYKNGINGIFEDSKKLIKQGSYKKSFLLMDRFFNKNYKKIQINEIDLQKLCRRMLYCIFKILDSYKSNGKMAAKKQSVQLLSRGYYFIGLWKKILMNILNINQSYTQYCSDDSFDSQDPDQMLFKNEEQDSQNMPSLNSSPINFPMTHKNDQITETEDVESLTQLLNLSNDIINYQEINKIPKKYNILFQIEEFLLNFLLLISKTISYYTEMKDVKMIFSIYQLTENLINIPELHRSTKYKFLDISFQIKMNYASLLFQLEQFERSKLEAQKAYNIASEMINLQLSKELQQNKQVDGKIDPLLLRKNISRQEENVKFLITSLVVLGLINEQMKNIEKFSETIHLINWVIKIFLPHNADMRHIKQHFFDQFNQKYSGFLLETGEVTKILQQVYNSERNILLNQHKEEQAEFEKGEVSNRSYQEKINNHIYEKYKHKELNSSQFIVSYSKSKEILKDEKKPYQMEAKQRDSIFVANQMNSQMNYFDQEQSTAYISKKDNVLQLQIAEDDMSASIQRSKMQEIYFLSNSFEPSLQNKNSQIHDHIYIDDEMMLTSSIQIPQNTASSFKNYQNSLPQKSNKVPGSVKNQIRPKSSYQKQTVIKPKLLLKSRYFPDDNTEKENKKQKYATEQNENFTDIYEMFGIKRPKHVSDELNDLDSYTGQLISEKISQVEQFNPLSKVINQCSQELKDSQFDQKEFGHCRRLIDTKRIFGNGTTLENDKGENKKDVHILDAKNKIDLEVKMEAYLVTNHIEAFKSIEELKDFHKQQIQERLYQQNLRSQKISLKNRLLKHSNTLGFQNAYQQYSKQNGYHMKNLKMQMSTINEISRDKFFATQDSTEDQEARQQDMKQILQFNEKKIKEFLNQAEKFSSLSIPQLKKIAKEQIKQESQLVDQDPRPKIPTHVIPLKHDANRDALLKSCKEYHQNLVSKHSQLALSTMHLNLVNEAKYASNLGDIISIKMKISKMDSQNKSTILSNRSIRKSILANLSNLTQSQKFNKTDQNKNLTHS